MEDLTCPACGYVAATLADLADHRIIRRYTDPDTHEEEPPPRSLPAPGRPVEVPGAGSPTAAVAYP